MALSQAGLMVEFEVAFTEYSGISSHVGIQSVIILVICIYGVDLVVPG